jgi:hypothetical protein
MLLACAFALAGSCQHDGASTGPGTTTGAIRVLFIGNSLTYTNELPTLVTALAAASGKTVETEMLAYPNYALIDHWTAAERAVVKNGHFKYVILQQGPSSLEVNRDSLRLWTALWAPEIRAAGATPALFAVWPEAARMFAFPDVNTSYKLAAQDVNGVFLPVGDTWLEVWSEVPSAELYGPDGYHPAIAGTYAAAVVIVALITHTEAIALAHDFPTIPNWEYGRVDSDLAATIRAAAQSVLDRNGLTTR